LVVRRADRLFQIVQLLRRDRLSTAQRLAGELGVSVRTVYRDVADLQKSGVAIEGEAGAGYRLGRHAELPALGFTEDELEALIAGARMIQAWSDPALREAACSALLKVEAAASPEVRRRLAHSEMHAPNFWAAGGGARFMGELRTAMRARRKVLMGYRRADGTCSERTVYPLGLFFWGHTWCLAGWCELRDEFRTFRLDRIQSVDVLQGTFQPIEGHTLADYIRKAEDDHRDS